MRRHRAGTASSLCGERLPWFPSGAAGSRRSPRGAGPAGRPIPPARRARRRIDILCGTARPGHATGLPSGNARRHERPRAGDALDRRLAEGGAEGRRFTRQARLAHARGHRRQAALHRGRRRGPALRGHAAGLRAVRARPAGDDVRGAGRGRSASTPASRPPRSRTPSTGATSPPAAAGRVGGLRPRDAPRLRLRPSARRRATSARRAWRSTPSRT